MNYEIEEVGEQDLEECAAVIRTGFLTVAEEFGITRANAPTNGAFLQKERLVEERALGHIMYALISEGKIVGYMQLEKSTPSLYFLQKLVVLPNYRHQGFGKALLDYAKARVVEWQGDKISIGIIDENLVLKNWYIKYGFVPTMTKKFEHLPFKVGFLELNVG